MKRVLAFALVALLAGSVCVAQEAAQSEDQGPVVAAIERTEQIVGKIVKVTVADPAKEVTAGTVQVADSMGNTTSVTVGSTAKIVDSALNAITLGQLKAGDTVKVETQKTKEGTTEAKAISVQ